MLKRPQLVERRGVLRAELLRRGRLEPLRGLFYVEYLHRRPCGKIRRGRGSYNVHGGGLGRALGLRGKLKAHTHKAHFRKRFSLAGFAYGIRALLKER